MAHAARGLASFVTAAAVFLGLQVLLGLWLATDPGFVPDLRQAQRAFDLEDWETAKRHLEPLSRRGSPSADYLLGEMYAEGKGVKRDVARALQHLERAAEADVVRAQFLLGRLYAYGEAVPRNVVRAHYWLSLAALQERQNVPELLRALEMVMSTSEIEEAWAMAERRVPGARRRVNEAGR